MFPLVLIGALGFWLWLKSRARGVTGASAASLAQSLNVVLLGGTAQQKQTAIFAYEKAKGLPMTGLYTVAIQHAMQDDGVTNPAPLPAAVTED